MKWFVSARSAETISSTIRTGDAPDWEAPSHWQSRPGAN